MPGNVTVPRAEVTLARLPILGSAVLLAWRKGFFTPQSSTGTVSFPDGRVLVLDMSDRTQRTMAANRFEPSETQVVRGWLQRGDVFVDVGAHVGWFTTLASNVVGPDGAVIAVEPFPSSFERLTTNVHLSGRTNVVMLNCALGADETELVLGPQVGSDSGSVTAAPRDRSETVRVACTRLDSLMDKLARPTVGRIALMKIDVEGLEPEVLAGAQKTLERTDAVLIEINANALAAAGSSESTVRGLLAHAGLRHQGFLSTPLSRRVRGHARNIRNLLATRTTHPLER